MAYYLRQTKKAKGIYLQVHESSWNKELKQPRSRSVEAIGYVDELVSDEIPDPVSYYKEYVDRLNAERAALSADETRPRAFVSPIERTLRRSFPTAFPYGRAGRKGNHRYSCIFKEFSVQHPIYELNSCLLLFLSRIISVWTNRCYISLNQCFGSRRRNVSGQKALYDSYRS